MNERIQELIKQATSIQGPTPYNPLTFEVFDKEKFALLIINQCIKAASDPGDGLIIDNTWHDGVRACIWSMQDEFDLDRNFGIK